MRCFIAITLPEDIHNRLSQIQKELKLFKGDINWTRPEGIHLTLKFLGEVDEKIFPTVKDVMEQACLTEKKFKLTTGNPGVFPNPRRPRVLWVGLKEGVETAGRLAKFLEEKLAPLGYPPEDREFNPHLTLGRVRSPQNLEPLMDYFIQKIKIDSMVIPAEYLTLYQSVLKPSGAEYQVVHKSPLLSL